MNKRVKNAINLSNFEKSPELAEISVSYKSKLKSNIKITNSKDAFYILFPLFDKNTIELKEEFILLLLNRANNFLGWFRLSSGRTNGTVVDVKIIFMLALQVNCCNLILSHNHPSNNIQPSDADIKLTNQIKEAGKIMDINVLDHLIIASNGNYFDFADEGLM